MILSRINNFIQDYCISLKKFINCGLLNFKASYPERHLSIAIIALANTSSSYKLITYIHQWITGSKNKDSKIVIVIIYILFIMIFYRHDTSHNQRNAEKQQFNQTQFINFNINVIRYKLETITTNQKSIMCKLDLSETSNTSYFDDVDVLDVNSDI